MNFVAIAGLAVAVLGLPSAWIAWRISRDSIRAATFDKVYEYVRAHQPELRALAWSASPSALRSGDVPMLTHPGWLFSRPKALESIVLELASDNVEASRRAGMKISLHINLHGTYDTYSKALAARPANVKMFNGKVYRPLSVQVTRRGLRISFSEGRYFDYLDSSEVLAYELGDRILRNRRNPAAGRRRKSIADPFDLASRPTSLGVNTLTIRKAGSGEHGFYMHKRSGSYVVNESDLIHVVPAGEFTPSDISYEAIKADFSVWRNIMREYAEEFLGIEESYGRGGKSLKFESDPPYFELSAARQRGELRVFTFGVTIDPLCLKPELLTVCVFEASAFDKIFADMISDNGEGILLVGEDRHGIPFTASNIKLYADNRETASAGVACLKLAWRYRKQLGVG